MSDKLDTNGYDSYSLLISSALGSFEALAGFLNGDLVVMRKAEDSNFKPYPFLNFYSVLAKHFLFEMNRLYRVIEHATNLHSCLPLQEQGPFIEARRDFVKKWRCLVNVRNVNEHGFDYKKSGKKASPSLHTHFDGQFALDETSLIILGANEILMGPINLADLYRDVLPLSKLLPPWKDSSPELPNI